MKNCNRILGGLVLVFIIFLGACNENKDKIDLLPFKEKGIINKQKVIFFTHLNLKRNNLGVLHLTRNFYEYALVQYNDADKVAIVFLVECYQVDNQDVTKYFSDWGYEDRFIIKNYESTSKRNRDRGESGVSYILRNDGEICCLTNPSLGKAFHEEMKKQIELMY